MIKSICAFSAESVIRDGETNRISAINFIEGIDAFGFPLFITQICFFSLWEKEENDPDRYEGEFILLLDDKELARFEIALGFSGKLRHRNIVTLRGLLLPKPGTLHFQVRVENSVAEFFVPINPPPLKVDSVDMATHSEGPSSSQEPETPTGIPPLGDSS